MIAGIRAYQVALSPLLGASCRFHPSCSEYALTAVAHDGVWRGGRRALRRLSRCHPWSGHGGLDLP